MTDEGFYKQQYFLSQMQNMQQADMGMQNQLWAGQQMAAQNAICGLGLGSSLGSLQQQMQPMMGPLLPATAPPPSPLYTNGDYLMDRLRELPWGWLALVALLTILALAT